MAYFAYIVDALLAPYFSTPVLILGGIALLIVSSLIFNRNLNLLLQMPRQTRKFSFVRASLKLHFVVTACMSALYVTLVAVHWGVLLWTLIYINFLYRAFVSVEQFARAAHKAKGD